MVEKDIIISFRINPAKDEALFQKLIHLPVTERNKMAKSLLYEYCLGVKEDITDSLDIHADKLDIIINKIIELESAIKNMKPDKSVINRVEHTPTTPEDKSENIADSLVESIMGDW